MKGGVERKLALALVRSFFALSIRDNNLLFSLACLGGYHWLRTRRLLRLQKANSSLAPLPLRFAAFSRRSTGREKPPRPWGWVSGRDAQEMAESGLPLPPPLAARPVSNSVGRDAPIAPRRRGDTPPYLPLCVKKRKA